MYQNGQTNLIVAIKKLSNEKLIQEINEFVKSKTCASISLYYPVSMLYRNMIHFVLEGDKDLSLGTKAQISAFIKSKINYDYSVDLDDEYLIVLDRELFKIGIVEQRFSEGTLYNSENYSSIIKFFMKNYCHLSPDLKNDLEAKQLLILSTSSNRLKLC